MESMEGDACNMENMEFSMFSTSLHALHGH